MTCSDSASIKPESIRIATHAICPYYFCLLSLVPVRDPLSLPSCFPLDQLCPWVSLSLSGLLTTRAGHGPQIPSRKQQSRPGQRRRAARPKWSGAVTVGRDGGMALCEEGGKQRVTPAPPPFYRKAFPDPNYLTYPMLAASLVRRRPWTSRPRARQRRADDTVGIPDTARWGPGCFFEWGFLSCGTLSLQVGCFFDGDSVDESELTCGRRTT